ncbi:MAG: GNAT family N-acetyltransferase [Pseudomonadota bacterium]
MIVEHGALPDDCAALTALNNAAVPAVNTLSEAEFAKIAAMGTLFVARNEGAIAGMLLLLPGNAAYESLNFAWFQARYDAFLYVDRVVVAPAAQALGVGRRLYEAGFALAAAEGFPRICAEVNVRPPNPGSHAFHARMGFDVLEERYNPAADKTVAMMTRLI